jgi:hypothetical protein
MSFFLSLVLLASFNEFRGVAATRLPVFSPFESGIVPRSLVIWILRFKGRTVLLV